MPILGCEVTIIVQPYLQVATPTSIRVMWETNKGEESRVEYGQTASLGSETVGESFYGFSGTTHHDVLLEGLQPASRYYYRVTTGAGISGSYDFITPAESADEASLRIVAISDTQIDPASKDRFREVVEDGLFRWLSDTASDDVAVELDMVLMAGDLVTTGGNHEEWVQEFFAPASELFSRVPLYPILGNHERDHRHYFDYFHLPENGNAEHWWWLDNSNVRFIGLDSNAGYNNQTQLSWLEGVLADTCVEDTIDFVFVELHHPYLSELRVLGESSWTGLVIEAINAFSEDCGKPSVHFYGHTHGYSRGQSRDHQHLWVSVATATGNIHDWGEYEQADYDEFVVSQAEYGWVIVDVTAGDDPGFNLRRFSRGNEALPRDNELRDEVSVRLLNTPPASPRALSPNSENDVDAEGILLVASPFEDSDGDLLGAAHWQLASSCDGFDSPLFESWKQHKNEWGGVDLQAEDDLADEYVPALEPGNAYCWRLRYRDRSLAWSEWSGPVVFSTAPSR
jgi:hypothetical protein